MKLSLFQGILLGVFAIAALIGLIVFATYSNTNTSATAIGTVVIWGTLPDAQMNDVLTAAAKVNQELKTVSYVHKDPATFESSLVSAIASGNGPDLVLISQEDLLALTKVLQLISPATLPASTLNNTFALAGQLYEAPGNAGTYGIPFLIDPLILYSNNAILSSSGIASPPTTWEALTGLVPKIVSRGGAGVISRGLIALGTYDNVHDARAILSAIFMQTNVPLSVRNSTGLLAADVGEAAEGGVPPGEAVLRFYTQFADPTKVSYTWNASLPDSQQAFTTGDLGLYIGYASEASYLKVANPNLDFDASPLPQPSTATNRLTYGLVYGFAIPRGSANPAGAYNAAATLVGSAIDHAAASATGLAPALRSLLSSPPGDALGAAAYASALYTRGWLSPAPLDTDRVFSAMISNVNSGRYTLSGALSSAKAALNALLQQ